MSLAEIEVACEHLSGGSGPERAAAERFLLNVRSSENALQLARAVIDASRLPGACFQAACILKEALLRDWHKISQEARLELQTHLLQLVVQRASGIGTEGLKPFVRAQPTVSRSSNKFKFLTRFHPWSEQLLHAFAVIVKRGWLEGPPNLITDLLNYVESLLAEVNTRAVGAWILMALLDEFSSSSRSVVGLSWEFHHSCQQRINDDGHLQRMFSMVLGVLAGSLDVLHAAAAATPNGALPDAALAAGGALAWLPPCVGVAEKLLSWDFADSDARGGMVGAFKSGRADVLAPGAAWREVLVNPATVDKFYALYAVCRRSPTAGHGLRQCLVDLAALRGDVFPTDAARLAYFDHSLGRAIGLITPQMDDSEISDVALILQRLLSNFQAVGMVRMPDVATRLEQICAFTCALMQRPGGGEDGYGQEALDHVLELWSGLAVQLAHEQGRETAAGSGGEARFEALLDSLGQYTGRILRCFTDKCMREAAAEVERWTNEEDDHEDRSVLDERLTAIGCIARPLSSDSVVLLTSLVAQRVEALRAAAGGGGASPADRELTTVQEQLHWLVRIAGHVMADEGEGEVPCIPDALCRLSLQAEAGGAPDPLVGLTNAVVQLVQLEDECRRCGRPELVSPLVVQTSVWYLSRWSQTYLFPSLSERAPLSGTLQATYGPGGGGEAVLTFLVQRVHSNLANWTTEEDVLNSTGALLLALAGRKAVAKVLLGIPGWLALSQTLVAQLARGGVGLLPPTTLGQMMQALCCSVAAVESVEQRSSLLSELVSPVRDHLAALLAAAAAQGPAASLQLMAGGGDSLLRSAHMLQGAARAADFFTYDSIFELVAPVLAQLPSVLGLTAEHHDMTAAIVQLYVAVAEAQVSYLSAAQTGRFNAACLQLLQTFASVEARDSAGPSAMVEVRKEWLRAHLLAVLQLLLHLARKDHVDFSDDSDVAATAGPGMGVAEVVLFGLSIVQPLVTPESLEFPPLAREFFGLLGGLVEAYPQMVSVMAPEALEPLMACLQHGILMADSDTARVSVEAIDALATHQISTLTPDGSYLLRQHHPEVLGRVLQALLEMLLFRQFNRAVLDAACDALHALLWCEQRRFQELMAQVVQAQVVPAQRQQVGDATARLLAAVGASGPAVERAAKQQFRRHLRAFLGEVRPFLVTI